jgi:hypothetical protein
MSGAFKRSGLHRLACDGCDSYVYATVAQLERAGLPSCGCGAGFVPDRVELAELLDVDCPARDEYRTELSSVMRGQASHGIRGRELRPAELVAFERVEKRRRERARSNRLSALLPAAEPLPF